MYVTALVGAELMESLKGLRGTEGKGRWEGGVALKESMGVIGLAEETASKKP